MELLNVHETEFKIGNSYKEEDAAMMNKLRKLDKINRILAHRPWAIKKHHIKVKINRNKVCAKQNPENLRWRLRLCMVRIPKSPNLRQ